MTEDDWDFVTVTERSVVSDFSLIPTAELANVVARLPEPEPPPVAATSMSLPDWVKVTLLPAESVISPLSWASPVALRGRCYHDISKSELKTSAHQQVVFFQQPGRDVPEGGVSGGVLRGVSPNSQVFN